VHDTQLVSGMVVNSMDKLYADKGYISKALGSDLLEQGVTIVNNICPKISLVGSNVVATIIFEISSYILDAYQARFYDEIAKYLNL
jgi:hypothetical protein